MLYCYICRYIPYVYPFCLRIYHWRMSLVCMNSQKPLMQFRWGTHASFLFWSTLINWVSDQGTADFFNLVFDFLIFACLWNAVTDLILALIVGFNLWFEISLFITSQQGWSDLNLFKLKIYVPNCCRHSSLVQRIIPEIRNYFAKALTKANSRDIRL